MNYELAKELKEAGFPQDGTNYTPDHGGSEETAAYYPSLSELIEACGESLFRIDFLPDQNRIIAYAYGAREGDGSTPEVAVAKLWLALNKHD